MKTASKNLLWTVGLGTCLPFATAQAFNYQYTVTDLGSLGGSNSQGFTVNNSGIAAGLSHLPGNQGEHAIVGQGLSLPQDLGTLGGLYSQAYGINNLGQVVGSAALTGNTTFHAFQWNGGAAPPLGALKDLKTLSPLVAGSYSRAFSINDSGQASGFSLTAAGTEHAVIWQNTGTLSDLGTLDGTGSSQGLAINANGQVAGFSSLTGIKATHAVLWAANGTKKDLGTLGGTHSAAYHINALGEVVGSATTALDGAQHAVFWGATGTATDLGTLGGTFSQAQGISTGGEVVGYSFLPGNSTKRAFVWQSGPGLGLRDLNKLLEPITGAAWTLQEAKAISEDGVYITGVGVETGVGILPGEKHAFLLKKVFVDTTPPLVSVTVTPAAPNVSGWYSVAPRVVWSVTDLESPVTTKVGCVNTPVVGDTSLAGVTFSCSATSTGGTTPTVTTPVLKVDRVAPVFVVSAPVSKAATSAGGAVVTYALPTATDALSGLSPLGVSCLPASGANFVVGATPVSCKVSDNAGNLATTGFIVTVAPVADITPPVVTSNLTGTKGLNGWFTSAVNVIWSVLDAQSALTSVLCAPVSVTSNGLNQVRTCMATSAGGSTTASTVPMNIDTIAPVFATCPVTVTLTQGTVLPALTATDNLSTAVVSNNAPASLPVGSTVVTWKATDNAGLSSACVQTVTVNPAVVDTIGITTAQCTIKTPTTGLWNIAGTSAISTNNAIQLYTSAVVPATLTSNLLGAPSPVAAGGWKFKSVTGPACVSPISLRGSASGTVKNNIVVNIK